ncbi:tetratricopeptide repeat protein [Aureivirga sp. CE67]|uniref:tetratricopeptide repeat protein n=1 Tax=Aureivirga sp. CE67 TaxID=1788983 RepID=UPI0018CB9EAA|nr:tetratricopeptide repeat protein [Aureivirga sp. CE67]
MKKLLLLIFLLNFSFIFSQNSVEEILYKADSIFDNGNYLKAIELIEKEKDSSPIFIKKIADIYYNSKNKNKALDYYLKYNEKEPSLKTKLKIAKIYNSVGRKLKALDTYEAIIKEDSLNITAKYQLSLIYLKFKNYDKAYEYLLNLTNQDSINPMYPYLTGTILEKLLHIPQSHRMYKEAFQRDPMHFKTLKALQRSYSSMKIPDSSNIFLDKALEISPSDKKLNEKKIKRLYIAKEYNTAFEYLKKYDAIYPKEYFSFLIKGMIYTKQKKWDEAEKSYLKAIFGDPENHKTYTYVAEMYREKGDSDKAAQYYFQAIAVGQPKLDEEHFQLAMLFKEDQKYKKALKHIHIALKQNGGNYKALFQQAHLYDILKKEDKDVLELYETYVRRYEYKNKQSTEFALGRISSLKKKIFMK